jgi:hypothetical protein
MTYFEKKNADLFEIIFGKVEIAQSAYRRATSRKAWFRFPEVQDFSLLHGVQTGTEAHPASYPMGTGELFPWREKRHERKADQSPRSRAEINNDEAIPPLPHTSYALVLN